MSFRGVFTHRASGSSGDGRPKDALIKHRRIRPSLMGAVHRKQRYA